MCYLSNDKLLNVFYNIGATLLHATIIMLLLPVTFAIRQAEKVFKKMLLYLNLFRQCSLGTKNVWEKRMR